MAGLQDALSLPNLVGPRRAGSTAPTVNIPPDAAPPTQQPTQPVPARAAPAPAAAGGSARDVAEEPAGAGDSSQDDADDLNLGEVITSRRDGEHARQKLVALDGSAK